MWLLYYFDYNDNEEPLLEVVGLYPTKKNAKDQIEVLIRPFANWLEKHNKIQDANRNRYFKFFDRHKDAIAGTEWGGQDRKVERVVEFLSLNLHSEFWKDPRYIDMSKVSEDLPKIGIVEEYRGVWYTYEMFKIKEIT